MTGAGTGRGRPKTPAQEQRIRRKVERANTQRKAATAKKHGRSPISPEAVAAASAMASAYGEGEIRYADLPPHPAGKRWHPRFVAGARMRAAGWDWPAVAQALGMTHGSVRLYVVREGWELLYGHFRAAYVAKLEDDLLEPALAVLRRLLDPNGKVSDFAALQAAQTVLNQRNLREKTLDAYLKAAQAATKGDGTGDGDGDGTKAPAQIVINNIIPEPSERRGQADGAAQHEEAAA